MKILMVNSVYAPHFVGGAEKSVQALAEEISRVGEEVVILTLAQTVSDRTTTINNVKVIYLNIRNIYNPFKKNNFQAAKPFWHALDSYNIYNQEQIKKVIASEKPDMVHSHSLTGISVAIWGTASAHNIPIIHTLRDYYLMCPRTTMYRNNSNCEAQCIDCRIYSKAKKAASTRVSGVIGISRYILMRHLDNNYFPNARFREVIYNIQQLPVGVESKSFEFHHPLRFGYLGRLHPTKGIEKLLIDFPREQELWIGGYGAPEYENLLRKNYSSPNIHFLGYVDPAEFLQQIDVLIVPSKWLEPFGRVIIEAYAHGIPVIASKHGGIPEIVEDGISGFLYEQECPGELADVIRRLAQSKDLYLAMRQSAYEKIGEFDPKAIVQRQMDFYYKVLA